MRKIDSPNLDDGSRKRYNTLHYYNSNSIIFHNHPKLGNNDFWGFTYRRFYDANHIYNE